MSKTILLADDSVTIRKVVELTFMDEDYELIAVGSGTEALDRLGPEIDLVIADVHMPGATGYEVCREAKTRFSSTPVLLLVGTFESYDEGEASAAGANDHLKKPFDSQDLLSRVRELLSAAPAKAASAAPSEPPARDEAVFEAAPAETKTVAVDNEVTSTAPARPHAVTPAPAGDTGVTLTDETVDRIARRVVEILSEEAIREVAWEVIPDLAEVVIKERLQELESEVE